MNNEYYQVDVFSKLPLKGNGLSVFLDCNKLNRNIMQKITYEFRQFESIFISKTIEKNTFKASVFTMEEELDFAGHPILGAAVVIYEKYFNTPEQEIILKLNKKNVSVKVIQNKNSFFAEMNQGKPEFIKSINNDSKIKTILASLNLNKENIAANMPLEVISTGLPYLIIPIKSGLNNAHIKAKNLNSILEEHKAKFVYIADINTLECRTWDNLGKVEDIATGSAAGPFGAYLVKHKIKEKNRNIIIKQGSYLNRPSKIYVKVMGTKNTITKVLVSGYVSFIARGHLNFKIPY